MYSSNNDEENVFIVYNYVTQESVDEYFGDFSDQVEVIFYQYFSN